MDKRITGALNVPGTFTGKVDNGANIGKTTEEIVFMWNEEHPDGVIDFVLEGEQNPFSVNLLNFCVYPGRLDRMPGVAEPSFC